MEPKTTTNLTTIIDLACGLQVQPTVQMMRTVVRSDVQGRARRYNTFALISRVSRETYDRCESSFRAYFGESFKDEGEMVVPGLLPRELFPFINAPIGNLADTLATHKQTGDPHSVYTVLCSSRSNSSNPMLDIRTDQTLYARMEKVHGAHTTVELAKVCPHRTNPDMMTLVLAGFYALSN